jgi:pantoate--beta-alanine ligase
VRVVESIADLHETRSSLTGPVGLVPTMGYLHEGHLSLIRRARAECASVIVSIFVNPTQFGPSEDLTRYPRDLPRDLRLCDEAEVDLVFVPTTAEVYPADSRTFVEVEGLQDLWEGASRPGHFRGVATVVAKLFRIALPDRAYFGEKDYQQLQIVRRMAQDLMLDVEVVGCPIVRDADGLALSSRNVYLTPEARTRALALSRALRTARERVAGGERAAAALRGAMVSVIEAAPDVELDYAAVVHPATLEPIETVNSTARALLAARVDAVRLIDNTELRPPDES